MSKIIQAEFPSLSASSRVPQGQQSAGVWSRPPKIPRKRERISRQARIGGIWIARWRDLGVQFFSSHTSGWVVDVIDRPINPNLNKEAQTFFHWFLEDLEFHGTSETSLEAINKFRDVYINKIASILREVRENPLDVDDDDAFKSHWFTALDNVSNAQFTFYLALRMIKAGRRDTKQMAEELYRQLPQEEKSFWKGLEQIGEGQPGTWSDEALKWETCRRMEEALTTIISWYQ